MCGISSAIPLPICYLPESFPGGPGCPVGEPNTWLLSRSACDKRFGYLRDSWGGRCTVGAHLTWALPLTLSGQYSYASAHSITRSQAFSERLPETLPLRTRAQTELSAPT